MGFVYILRSESLGMYYIGCSDNVERRLLEHNSNQVKATRSKGPWVLVFEQEFENMTIARKIESKLKKFKSKDILERIIEDGEIKMSV